MNEHVRRLIARGEDVRGGLRYGRLRALGTPFWIRNDRGWREAAVVCECGCGDVCVVSTADLRRGRVRSCGCLQRSLARA
jgi:hypothetical protein